MLVAAQLYDNVSRFFVFRGRVLGISVRYDFVVKKYMAVSVKGIPFLLLEEYRMF